MGDRSGYWGVAVGARGTDRIEVGHNSAWSQARIEVDGICDYGRVHADAWISARDLRMLAAAATVIADRMEANGRV